MNAGKTKPMAREKARLSFRKKLLYGMLVTSCFYLTLEILLAAFDFRPAVTERDPFVGFESSVPLFDEEKVDDVLFLKTAANKLSYFNAQRFPKRKAPNSYRIFCLGGSTTYGRPYNDATSFVGWLRELLSLTDESRNWEVINAGGISYASYRVANVLEELCAYKPDLFVIYTGHNEFLEERTYRSQRAGPAGLRRVQSVLYRTRTFSLAAELFGQHAPPADSRWLLPQEVDTILDHAVGPRDYHRNPRLRANVLEHFRFNLSKCINAARSVGADVVLVKPAFNFKDFSPFKSETLTELTGPRQQAWLEFFSQAMQQAEAGNAGDALASLDRAEQIDSGRADLQFLKGQLLLAEERFAEAHESFLRAVDQDICPLRALPAIQDLIEQAAVTYRVPLVDFASILEHDCQLRYGHNSPGSEYFLDHVHPTIEANRLLALALVEVLRQRGTVSPNERWREEAVALASRKIESRVDVELQARALTNLAQVLSWAGKQEEAGPLAVEAVRMRSEQRLEDDPESMFYAAVYFTQLGSDDQATQLLARVVHQQPENLEARRRLAWLLVDQLQYDEAQVQLEELLRADPTDESARHLLDQVLSK